MTKPKKNAVKKASAVKKATAVKKVTAVKKATAAKKAAAAKKVSAPKKAGAKQPSSRRRAQLGTAGVAELGVSEIESLRAEVQRKSGELLPRWNANPEDVQKSVAQLVLALVEFLRKLLERQAIRRMEAETLESEEIERIGVALMRLEETVHDLAGRFGLAPEELNLDLGPLGRLT